MKLLDKLSYNQARLYDIPSWKLFYRRHKVCERFLPVSKGSLIFCLFFLSAGAESSVSAQQEGLDGTHK